MKKIYLSRCINLRNLNFNPSCFGLLLAFAATEMAAQCNNNTVLSITGPTTATWTAPAGGPFSVRINATGAAGGAYLEGPDRTGGTGATMSGTFVVQSGETIRAIAGGGGFHSGLEGGGAGGGSGAVNCGNPSDCANGEILIVAAGGNGGQLGGPNGGFGLGGSSGTGGDGDGGLNGGNNDGGGGGGGLNTAGQGANSGGQGGGKIVLTGLAAGGAGSFNPISGNNRGGDGMGGGAGGGDGATTDNAAGGAGGHTGGDGGNLNSASSFNSGSNQANTDGVDGGGAAGGAQSNPSNPGTVSIVCLAALPVELIDFKAVIQKNEHVMLLWSTATEKNNLGYEVERSIDNRDWTPLGFVPGNGTTAQKHDYKFTDHNPLAGVNYYRLKQSDLDGKHEYSPMVVADVRASGLQFDLFPNPSGNGKLSVRTVSKQEGEGRMEIFDWAGYRVYKEKIYLYEGTTVWPVLLTTYPKGAYTARLELPDGSVEFKKILLQ